VPEYKLLEPSGDPQKDVSVLVNELLPIFPKFWNERGRSYYKFEKWNVQAVPFTMAWMGGSIVIVLAREAGETVGFLFGARLQPLLCPAAMFQVEAYYGTDAVIEKGLIDYLLEHFKFFPENFLILPAYEGRAAAVEKLGEFNSYSLKVYRK
jgi:hypothetical protein